METKLPSHIRIESFQDLRNSALFDHSFRDHFIHWVKHTFAGTHYETARRDCHARATISKGFCNHSQLVQHSSEQRQKIFFCCSITLNSILSSTFFSNTSSCCGNESSNPYLPGSMLIYWRVQYNIAVHVYIYMHACMHHVFMYSCIHVIMYSCMYVWMDGCMHACMYCTIAWMYV